MSGPRSSSRDEIHNDDLQDGITTRFIDRLSNIFAKYARFVTTFWYVPVIIGIIFLAAMTTGFLFLEEETDLNYIWVKQTSRIKTEVDTFKKYFGGLPRDTDVIAQNKGGRVDSDSLDNFRSILANVADIDGDGISTTRFCDAPSVPIQFQPSIPLQKVNVTQNHQAFLIEKMSQCLNRTTTGLTADPLPENWGIRRFPCRRQSILDCFAEGSDRGNSDYYPIELQQLEDIVPEVVKFVDDVDDWDDCAAEVFGEYPELGNDVPGSVCALSDTITTATAVFNCHLRRLELISLPLWQDWGYVNRVPWAGKSASEISTYLTLAFSKAKNDTFVPQDCISGQSECCVTWEGKKIEQDVIIGNLLSNGVDYVRSVQQNFHWDHPNFVARSANFGLTSSAARKSAVRMFEQNVIKVLEPEWTSPTTDTRVVFKTGRSNQDMFDETNSYEWNVVIIGLILLGVVVIVSAMRLSLPKDCNDTNVVYSHVTLVIFGMGTITCANFAAVGFLSYIGVAFTPFSGTVAPLLAISLGVDEMFVFVYSMIYNREHRDPADRLVVSYSNVGCASSVCFLCSNPT